MTIGWYPWVMSRVPPRPSPLHSGTTQTSVRPSRPATRRWTRRWRSSPGCVALLSPRFAEIAFEHTNDFSSRKFPLAWLPNKLGVELAIKYGWRPPRFFNIQPLPPPAKPHGYFYLSQTELHGWGQLPGGAARAVQVHQQILRPGELQAGKYWDVTIETRCSRFCLSWTFQQTG